MRTIPVTAVQHVAKRRDWGSGFLLGIVPPLPRTQQDGLKGTKFSENYKHPHPEGLWLFLRVTSTKCSQDIGCHSQYITGGWILHVLRFLLITLEANLAAICMVI